ncbi:uncharacterized protein M6B38_365130 [Iris pallida]|uniref:C3H1-type domain-containing protein n=1 Tax=Iris pallida TaxID=29817 RepID=A0AAX6GHX2_IRIPA|nr:uncharacterized protein M6B38_365130 [Iris pallida]
MYGQGNYAPQYRPPPPFQQPQSDPLPPPPYQQGPPHPLYQHGMPLAQQSTPSYMPPPQPYIHPPPIVHGNSPMPSSYTHPGTLYPPHPMPPPPRMLPSSPLPQSHSQGQPLYRNPHPHPPGIQHMATPPPIPSGPGFLPATPASFTPLAPPLVGDACPPFLPPPPPPPPPPSPPSSPPPLPASPPPPASPNERYPDSVPKVSPHDTTKYMAVFAPVVLGDNVPGNVATVGDGNPEGRIPVIKAGGDFASPPPKPADKEVVRNIEVLCDFIVKVGPHFENLARTNEAGNPRFAFLFGGEPGSAAAIGHEYFQWMKRKYLSEVDSRKEQEKNGSMSSALKLGGSSQFSNLEHMGAAVSPAGSDMDMEDDVSRPDVDSGKELTEEPSKINVSKELFHAPRSNIEQLLIEVAKPRALSYNAPVAPLHDGEEDEDSQYIEDVSPVRASPEATECDTEKNAQGSIWASSGESSLVKVAQTLEGGRTEEAPKVYVKDGSPFRLIQGYASDGSEEDDQTERFEQIATVRVSSTAAAGVSVLHQDKRSEPSSSFKPENVFAEEGSSDLPTDLSQTSSLKMLSEGKPFGSSPQKDTAPSAVCHSPADLESELCARAILLQDGHHVGKQDSTKVDVDEFGRLVRKGASDSDSDEIRSNERGVKRGRSRSRSPQGSRWRRRSGSPRRREKRSRSRSWSPQRNRSKSPPGSRRTNVFARRGRDQPPECFNFNKGRCFRGASCRFLHRDFTWHMGRQQQYKDFPRDSGKYVGHDGGAFSESKGNATVEMDVERCTNAPQEEEKSIEMQVGGAQSDSTARSHNYGELEEKDPRDSVPEDAVTIKIDDKQVNDKVSPEVITSTEEPLQVEKVSEASISAEEPYEFPQPFPNESMPSQLSPAGTTERSQISPPTTSPELQSVAKNSHGEKSLSRASQTIQPSDIFNQHPYTEPCPSTAPGTQAFTDQSSMALTDQSSMAQSDSNSVPTNQIMNQSSQTNEFPLSSFSGPDVNYQASKKLPPGPPVPPPLHPHFPPGNPNAPFASQHSMPPSTSYHSHPPLMSFFPSHRHPMPGENHSQSLLPAYPGWSSVPPVPPPSHSNALSIRPSFTDFPPQHPLLNSVPLRHDLNPSMRFYPPGETGRPLGGNFHQQPFHSMEAVHQHSFHSDESRRPLPMGSLQESPLAREERLTRPPMPQDLSELQRDYHLRNQPFLHEESRLPLPGQGFGSTSSLTQGGARYPHSVPLPGESLPHRLHSFPADMMHSRPSSRDEFSTTARDLPYPHHPQPHGLQHPTNSSFTLNSGPSGLVDISSQRYPSSFPEKPSQSFDIGLPRMPISSHYNPYASTFDQAPTNLKFASRISGQENDKNYKRYDPSLISGHVSVGGPRPRLTASPPNSARSGEQFLSKPGIYSQELNAQKQAVSGHIVGDPYDPLFDSIEPPSNAPKKLDRAKGPKPVVTDAGCLPKFSSLSKADDGDEQKEETSAKHKADIDEFGEVATDAEVGAVENASPQPVDEKDWSPPLLIDMLNDAAGEIEIDLVQSPGKSKKTKDCRSMRLFKIALANFVKEVLKPSWRQGNMSKEAFKTIVKKTVNKVSGAMSSHQIPKSQAKINQYVESSQRKLTKLVTGYVDKYVKM